MPQDTRLQFLINNLQEGLDVEVKNWLGGLQDDTHRARLAKEIIALANNGGGYVFIGFNDDGAAHDEIVPTPEELAGFTQDDIASLVNRYITPPCQCRLEFVTREGSTISHPVIVVPGQHRTPLFAARSGPNNDVVQGGRVYIRRPGGSSEEARDQNDWEQLLERLVKARQTDILAAIREILEPSKQIMDTSTESLADWRDENYRAWQTLVSNFPEDDPRRLRQGHWSIAFSIAPFNQPSLSDLNDFLDRQSPKYSGWPPFTYPHRDSARPRANGNEIVAYLGNLSEGQTPEMFWDHSDYWKFTREGRGYMLRPMQEDRAGFMSNVYPQPERPLFDWTLPIYRMIEVFKLIEATGQQFGGEQAQFHLILNYFNTKNRKLVQHDHRYNLRDHARCHSDTIEATVQGSVSAIETNLEEITHSLLQQVYEQFEFTKLPRVLVSNVAKEVLDYRRR